MTTNSRWIRNALCAFTLTLLTGAAAFAQDQGNRPPGTHQDNTPGTEWIKRLERPERIPGLRIPDVIAALKLKPGDVIADIGAGTGAYTLDFAKAVAPSGKAFAVDIWPELMDYISGKAKTAGITNLQTILAKLDDPLLPKNQVDVVFFHDVFHNTNDRQAYLKTLTASLKPTARIAIIEQEYDDPIAKKWDKDEDRITPEQLKGWMAGVGFQQTASFDMFKGKNNPPGTAMPERWFVVYSRAPQPAPAAELPLRAGVLTSSRGETVLSMGGPLMAPGTKLTLVSPGTPQTLRTIRIVAESPNDGDDFTERMSGPYYEVAATDGNKPLPAFAVAVLNEPAATKIGEEFSLKMSAALPDVRAKWCASYEGIHFTLWSGEPLKGSRLWHVYYSAGGNLRPTCDPLETQDDGGR